MAFLVEATRPLDFNRLYFSLKNVKYTLFIPLYFPFRAVKRLEIFHFVQ